MMSESSVLHFIFVNYKQLVKPSPFPFQILKAAGIV